ncbi:MAG: right-handed parallel beta-helix repeat-containing protein, partial [Candidatus Micrarchaeota archaeon]|nr:right-handed parallel beta-helix repeat-containing protein [Candidatus Micrarchaeota archaeon]
MRANVIYLLAFILLLSGFTFAFSCGDRFCDWDENLFSCPQDCSKPPVCGNHVCDAYSELTSCPQDCFLPGILAECPNAICEEGEQCRDDCPTEEYCFDLVNNDEDSYTDCGDPDCSSQCCGNTVCESYETPYSCPNDCGLPPSGYCGGAYNGGDWVIDSAVSCSNENIPVDGSIILNSNPELFYFANNIYQITKNSAPIPLEIPDRIGDEPNYTGDWEPNSNAVFKIMANESEHTIKVFITTTLEDQSLYAFDLDNNPSNNIYGYEMSIGTFNGFGLANVTCLINGMTRISSGSAVCGDSSYNYTVYVNISDASPYTYEVVIKVNSPWTDFRVSSMPAGNGELVSTTFVNSEPEFYQANLTLNNVTITLYPGASPINVTIGSGSIFNAYNTTIDLRQAINRTNFTIMGGSTFYADNLTFYSNDTSMCQNWWVGGREIGGSASFTLLNSNITITQCPWEGENTGSQGLNIGSSNSVLMYNILNTPIKISQADSLFVEGNVFVSPAHGIVIDGPSQGSWFVRNYIYGISLNGNVSYTQLDSNTVHYISTNPISGQSPSNNDFRNNNITVISDNGGGLNRLIYSTMESLLRWEKSNLSILSPLTTENPQLSSRSIAFSPVPGAHDNLNTTASLEFYNTFNNSVIRLLKDGTLCESPECNVSYDSGSGVFYANVSSFSEYKIKYCNDTFCAYKEGENRDTCPADCYCGNGGCEPGEACSDDCEFETHCKDGVDNDEDTATDCADSDCEYDIMCAGAGYAHEISSEGTFVLTSDYSGEGYDAAIGITSGNVILDLNGHIIENGTTGIYVAPGLTNITIMNGTVRKTSTCIFVESSNTTLITDMDIYSCGTAIYLDPSYNNSIIGNNIYSSDYYGIKLDDSHNNTIANNTIYNISIAGIYLNQSTNNTLLNNTISTNLQYGLYALSSLHNNFTSNKIYNNSEAGVSLQDSGENIFYGNEVYNNSYYGFYIYHSYGNVFEKNAVYNNTQEEGFRVVGGGNLFLNNSVYGNRGGFFIAPFLYGGACIGSTLINNTLTNNSYGISISSCNDSIISGGQIYNGGDGITLYYNSSNITISNISLYNNSLWAFWMYAPSGTSVSANGSGILIGDALGLNYTNISISDYLDDDARYAII